MGVRSGDETLRLGPSVLLFPATAAQLEDREPQHGPRTARNSWSLPRHSNQRRTLVPKFGGTLTGQGI
eukprot:1833710-Prymnesium_polylepis.1